MAITFGDTGNPSNITVYLDSVFAQSLANYRKKLTDNIGASNEFLRRLMKSDAYESADGGTYIAEPLMYQLAPMDSYDGYDELSTVPTDGITEAIYEWRQLATPIAYSMKEVIQNEHKIIDLVKSRILQGEMGIQEGFATQLMQGSGNGGLATPKVSGVNGSTGIEPISKIIAMTPTNVVGNINSNTESWWKNKTKSSVATTYDAFLLELLNLRNSCALGSGGGPDLLLMDQTSYELFNFAWYNRYRASLQTDQTVPFENVKWGNMTVVMDDKVPDVEGGLVSTATNGTAFFINSKFFRLRYHPSRNFEMLKDENGKTFAKPINGDSRVGHIGWMGNLTCNNRRKQGILYGIARTLTV